MSAECKVSREALQAVLDREAEAAARLRDVLRQARTAVEKHDAEGLDAALQTARDGAEELARAGGRRMKALAHAARELGLPAGADLTSVGTAVGRATSAAATRLNRILLELARESATLGVCVRYGVVASGRMINLRRALSGSHGGYGANGQLTGPAARRGRHA